MPILRFLVIYSFAFVFFFYLEAASADIRKSPVADPKQYGLLPNARALTISPDAKYFAYITLIDSSEEVFIVKDLSTGKTVSGARLGDLKARSIYFIDNDHVVFRASDTAKVFGYKGKFEASGAFVMNIFDRKVVPLLNKTQGLHPAQSGLGRIAGYSAKARVVYMPAYETGNSPAQNLYKVSLKHGKGIIYKRGNSSTIDWFLGKDGQLLARIDYVNSAQRHKVYSYASGERKLVYEKKTPTPDVDFSAVSKDLKKLLFIDTEGLKSLSLHTGDIELIELHSERAGIAYLKTDLNRHLRSTVYDGLLPYEKPVNGTIAAVIADFKAQLGHTHISMQAIDQSETKLVLYLSGSDSSGSFVLYDLSKKVLTALVSSYPDIEKNQIGEIVPIRYTARDQWKIPAILTWPVGVAKGTQSNLPLIVLPHGGPASYDSIRFDWWAQFLARKGYLVLQPNFRGSTGFGLDHQEQGEGEWGKLMQDDVSDGISALVDAGHADPERVCIIGASYGGYSALAGGAFSPELFRCVVSVAGVANLPVMLSDVKQRRGKRHWVNRYWKRVIGDSKAERAKLKELSPALFAKNFKAPVLLIHGKDDTVVPYKQSLLMHRALKKAGKSSELVKLKGEDHWLSKSDTRLAMLEAIDRFLDQHNPVE